MHRQDRVTSQRRPPDPIKLHVPFHLARLSSIACIFAGPAHVRFAVISCCSNSLFSIRTPVSSSTQKPTMAQSPFGTVWWDEEPDLPPYVVGTRMRSFIVPCRYYPPLTVGSIGLAPSICTKSSTASTWCRSRSSGNGRWGTKAALDTTRRQRCSFSSDTLRYFALLMKMNG